MSFRRGGVLNHPSGVTREAGAAIVLRGKPRAGRLLGKGHAGMPAGWDVASPSALAHGSGVVCPSLCGGYGPRRPRLRHHHGLRWGLKCSTKVPRLLGCRQALLLLCCPRGTRTSAVPLLLRGEWQWQNSPAAARTPWATGDLLTGPRAHLPDTANGHLAGTSPRSLGCRQSPPTPIGGLCGSLSGDP